MKTQTKVVVLLFLFLCVFVYVVAGHMFNLIEKSRDVRTACDSFMIRPEVLLAQFSDTKVKIKITFKCCCQNEKFLFACGHNMI